MRFATALTAALVLVSNVAYTTAKKPPSQCVVNSDGSCCVNYDGTEVLPTVNDKLEHAIPDSGFVLEGNALGQDGRKAELSQCILTGGTSRAFGWNWTRGTTQTKCLGKCLVQDCLAQFSMLQLRYGISPLSGKSSGATNLPTKHSTLANLFVKLNADISWVDDSPKNAQAYRNSLLLDMFLSSDQPKEGKPVGTSVTDEIVVDVAYNRGYAPACNQFQSKPWSPVPVETFQAPDGNVWEYMVSESGDTPGPPGVVVRMNHFILKGGAGTRVPSSIDVLPIIQHVQNHTGDYSATWLGDITIGSALYDNTHGHVTFPSLPVINAINKKHDGATASGASIIV